MQHAEIHASIHLCCDPDRPGCITGLKLGRHTTPFAANGVASIAGLRTTCKVSWAKHVNASSIHLSLWYAALGRRNADICPVHAGRANTPRLHRAQHLTLGSACTSTCTQGHANTPIQHKCQCPALEVQVVLHLAVHQTAICVQTGYAALLGSARHDILSQHSCQPA